MTTKFPSLTEYIDKLPNGLDSYPECEQKGSVLRALLSMWPELPTLAPDLPPVLGRLVTEPPPPNLWVPECHGMALWALSCDVVCNNEVAKYIEFSRKGNRALLSNPIYRIIFGVLGARLTVRAIATAWSTFHRGMNIEVELSARGGTFSLNYPSQLLSEPHAHGYSTAFVEALIIAGYSDARVDVESWTPTKTAYRCTW